MSDDEAKSRKEINLFSAKDLKINDKEADHFFSNLITLAIIGEEVVLGLGVRGVKEEEINNVKIDRYLHLTIPHFLRTVELFNRNVDFIRDNIVQGNKNVGNSKKTK